MSMVSLGDLAQSLMLRHQNVQMRQTITKLSEEMSTGRVADISGHLLGDYSHLSDIERNLGLVDAYRSSAAEAGSVSAAMQIALGHVQDVSSQLSRALFETSESTLSPLRSVATSTAKTALGQIISALNTQSAGRSLFAGNMTDQPALISADKLIAAMAEATTGETTAAGIKAAIDLWFDGPTATFQTVAYQGSNEGVLPFRLDRHGTVDLDLRANSPHLRDILKHATLAVMASDPAKRLSDTDRAELFRIGGGGLLNAQDGLTALRADLGFAEAKIEEGKVRLASEKSSFELARSTLLSVDQFNTATLLENAQSRLESLYAVTVRLSRLSLAEFMR
jgi:flagellar hook-associated protein 3 FlgL